MMNKNLIKLYSITFNSYTNCLDDTVSDGNKDVAKTKYEDVPSPFIITENTISYYQKFGGGIKTLIFVGYLNPNIIPDSENRYEK